MLSLKMVFRHPRKTVSRKETIDTTMSSIAESSTHDRASPITTPSECASLGTGEFNPSGTVTCFTPNNTSRALGGRRKPSSPRKFFPKSPFRKEKRGACSDEPIYEEEMTASYTDPSDPEVIFERDTATYLRVTELDLPGPTKNLESGENDVTFSHHDGLVPCYHYPSHDPPPHVTTTAGELWLALDNGIDAKPSPLAKSAVSALAEHSRDVMLDEDFWTPDAKTLKILNEAHDDSWKVTTFDEADTSLEEAIADMEILIWTGKFTEQFGAELPAIRSAAIIPMSAAGLYDLLSDSTRVQEYNAMSLGRTDILTLDENTKVCCAESRPPMIRKTIRLVTLMHTLAQPNEFYQISTRAVENGSTTHSEILLGTNVIRPLSNNSCLLIAINHMYSNLIPTALAKRMGSTAATNFVTDLRKVETTT